MNETNKTSNSAFIVTRSKDTANFLIKSNFNLVNQVNGMWFFVNEPGKVVFDNPKDINYTNKIFI